MLKRIIAITLAGAMLLAAAPDSLHAQAAYSAAFVGQTVPSFIAIGTTANVSVTM
jgi:hypothetical protein